VTTPRGRRIARLRRLAGGALAGGLALALTLFGCAKTVQVVTPPPARDDLYVLLPAQDGKTGALEVTHGTESRVLDAPFAAARIKVDGRVETGVATEQEIKQVFGDALGALPPRPAGFTLYFLEGRDELTPDSRQTLRQVLDEVARRPAAEIEVVGHTDRVGAVAANDRLSVRRAERVRDELARLGVAADRLQASGRGEREPLIPTEDEVPEPRNRRVEISIR
jgi:outer membrane protein OmpA-like peptidoglycan-associated protein